MIWPSPFFRRFQNGCNKVVIEPRAVQFGLKSYVWFQNRTSAHGTHTWKNIEFFFVFDIANQLQLLARHSPFAPLGQPSLYSIQGRLSEFFRIIVAKTLKIRIAYRQWRSNFPRRRKNKNTERKSRKLLFQSLC